MSTQITTHPVTPEERMAFLDGELSADRAQSVSAHTESCPQCQHVFASLLHTARSLTGWTVGAAPSLIEERVYSVASQTFGLSATSGPMTFTSTRSWPRKKWLVGIAATAGVVVLSFFFLSSFHLAAPSVDTSRVNFDRPLREPAFTAAPPGSRAVPQDKNLLAMKDFSKMQVHEQLQRPVDQALPSGPMIARTVSLAILVKDFDADRKALDSILVRYNGYAANLTVSTPQGAARSLEASLRIPVPQLPAALAELKALGHVENENQNGEEVTQQHADLVARLKNSRETEQRLQAILTQRTGKISDVLEVEQEIARVRGEIEQMEAEQKNLEHRVDFATVDLKLAEEYKAKLESTAPSFSTEFHNARVNGYRNVADTLVALLLFFAEYGPILLFWALVLFVPAWLVWRRWRQVASPAM